MHRKRSSSWPTCPISLSAPPLTVTSTCFDVYFWKEEPPPPAAYSKARILHLSSCPIFESTFVRLRFPAIFAGSGPGHCGRREQRRGASQVTLHTGRYSLFPLRFFSQDKQTNKKKRARCKALLDVCFTNRWGRPFFSLEVELREEMLLFFFFSLLLTIRDEIEQERERDYLLLLLCCTNKSLSFQYLKTQRFSNFVQISKLEPPKQNTL